MKGMTVQLVKKTQTGTDPFGAPIETEELIDVPDCLVGQPSTDEISATMEMYGKQIAYVVGVPKGDENTWVDTDVIIWGERFRTIGYPMTGIQENIPLRWGKNVKVERYG
jgi:hypothetical protein